MVNLFEHNRIAYGAAVSMMREAGKAAVIHPTGTGKSFIGFKLCEDNPDKVICWLSPSEYIFKTQLENLSKVSDGFQPDNIRFFTYARLMNLTDEELADIHPDYIVFDEFHRCGAQEWGKGVAALLELYEDVPILGLSATNIRYLDNQRDMADELFGGNIASEMTLGEAIVRGILAAPKYVLSVFSYEKELEKYQKRVRLARNKAVRDEAERYLDALRRALDKADGLDVIFDRHITERTGKYIVFCANFEHMREMIEKVPEWFSKVDSAPKVYSVYSADPSSDKSFAYFKADNDASHLRLLFCIDALNEGIHVDDVAGVILLRPTVSPIIYKQQIGRALAAGRQDNPVIFDIVNNFENLYSIGAIEEEMKAAIQYYRFRGDGSEIIHERFRIFDEVRDCRRLFDELNDTLSASWNVMYAVAKRYYDEHGDLCVPYSYRTEDGYSLGEWLVGKRAQHRKGALPEEEKQALDALGMDWLTQKERQWENAYCEAEKFYRENGHLRVPSSMHSLNTWVIRQRANYRGHTITDEQYRRLSAIGMVWDVDDVWESNYAKAKKFYEEYGNLDIPADYITEDGVCLGRWYRRIRGDYLKGILPKERMDLLDAIGMQRESVIKRKWMQNYEYAKRFYEENGHLNVHLRYVTPDGAKLGIWISGQRESYKAGKLTEEQVSLLEKIGIHWNRFEADWDSCYSLAKDYFDQNGNLNIAADYVTEDGVKLGVWLAKQKAKHRKFKLSGNQTEALEKIGIVWNSSDDAWETGYRHAEEYFRINGNLNVKNGYVCGDGFKLAMWLNNKRTAYRNGKLPTERTAALENIGMEWNRADKKWEQAYREAEGYYRAHRNLNVPQSYRTESGFYLSYWVVAQKKSYQAGKLDGEKVRRLRLIGMRFEGAKMRPQKEIGAEKSERENAV